MAEAIILKEIKECPVCGSSKTMYREANKEAIEKGKTTNYIPAVSLNGQLPAEMIVIPLSNPMISLSMGVLIEHFDTCFDCGTRYCVLAEKSTSVVQMQQAPRK